jgi:pimeloyl-ACP methyl ester carboxylesterase
MPAIRSIGRAVQAVLGSTKFGRDAADVVELLEGFQEPRAVAAFARTLRSVVDGGGQYVTMLDRIELVKPIPVQVIWGDEDLIIPVEHARTAHAAIPGSRLEIFENSGHLPMHDHPDRFVEVVERFVDSTCPAECDQELLRSLLRTVANGDTDAAGPAAATPDSAAS